MAHPEIAPAANAPQDALRRIVRRRHLSIASQCCDEPVRASRRRVRPSSAACSSPDPGVELPGCAIRVSPGTGVISSGFSTRVWNPLDDFGLLMLDLQGCATLNASSAGDRRWSSSRSYGLASLLRSSRPRSAAQHFCAPRAAGALGLRGGRLQRSPRRVIDRGDRDPRRRFAVPFAARVRAPHVVRAAQADRTSAAAPGRDRGSYARV